MKIRLIFLAIPLLLPAMAVAEGTLCNSNETIIVPDGRITQSYIPAGTTFRLAFYADLGHSYSVEVRTVNQVYSFPLAVTVYDSDGGANKDCTGLSKLSQRYTTSISPQIYDAFCEECNGATRFSFTEPHDYVAPGFFHDVTIVNNNTVGTYYTFSVSDTTMFSPGFTTYSGYNAYYVFANTTTYTINITLTLFDDAGNQTGSKVTAAIPGRGTYFTNTFALGVPPSTLGSARLTHDGPPGAIVATATNANFSVSAAQTPLPFIAVREKY